MHISEEMDRVVFRKKKEFPDAAYTNSVPIAAFVTSYARCHLYEFMEKIDPDRLLYCDTDSLHFVRVRGVPDIDEGERLGDMMREKKDRRIVEFFCAGPKNYGERHVDASTGGDEKCDLKIRGFSLTYSARKLTFEKMRDLVLKQFRVSMVPSQQHLQPSTSAADYTQQEFGNVSSQIDLSYSQICRNKRAQLYTQTSNKKWRPVFAKSRIMPANLTTRPFGFNEEKDQQI